MDVDVDTDTHSNKYAHNGKVLLGSATLLFFMLIFLIFIHTYFCSCFRRRPQRRLRRRNRHLFPTATADPHTALDHSLFKFLPTFTYSSATHLHLQECAVCLSEFEEDDDGRVLPNCNHCFHTHCIDTWFRSHSNCPICRALVQLPPKTEAGGEFAGCSYLPPPISCPRKELDLAMVRVIVEASKDEMGENLRNSAGDARLKGSDGGLWEWGPSPAQPAHGRKCSFHC